MGLKSVLGKIGKVALKVAPYAAMAIPGVGVPLGMAIKGGLGAASGAMGGGGLKGALIGGGLGAAGGALGGAGGALSKIGPSSSVLSKLGAGAAGKALGTGVTGKIGGVLGSMATNALGKQGPLIDTNDFGPQTGTGVRSAIGNVVDAVQRNPSVLASSSRTNPSNRTAPPTNNESAVPRSSGNAPGFSYNSNNPNLANSILAGRQNAVRNQPFRAGYDITAPNPDDPKLPPVVISHMPKIRSDFAPIPRPRRQKNQDSAGL